MASSHISRTAQPKVGSFVVNTVRMPDAGLSGMQEKWLPPCSIQRTVTVGIRITPYALHRCGRADFRIRLLL